VQGVLNVAVHHDWAPIGAGRLTLFDGPHGERQRMCAYRPLCVVPRFLDMVRSNFFSTKVPLFRALKDFLVQFGLAGEACGYILRCADILII
jgi:hypothetical protein